MLCGVVVLVLTELFMVFDVAANIGATAREGAARVDLEGPGVDWSETPLPFFDIRDEPGIGVSTQLSRCAFILPSGTSFEHTGLYDALGRVDRAVSG